MVLLLVGNTEGCLALMFLYVLAQLNFGIISLIPWAGQTLFKVLLNLFMMLGISKYYIYSSRRNLYENLGLLKFVRYISIADLVSVEYFTDGFFNIKFHGVCVSKTNKGLASSFVLSDKFSLQQRFFVFSPYVRRVIIFSRRLRKVYFLLIRLILVL